MTPTKVMIAVAALAALGSLASCGSGSDTGEFAPAAPEPTAGPVAQSNSLNGTYNLRQADCGNTDSPTRLVIDGNRFSFPETICTVTSSEKRVDSNRVVLSCEGNPAAGNRVLDLQVNRSGTLRITEDEKAVNFYQCMRAAASSSSLEGQTM